MRQELRELGNEYICGAANKSLRHLRESVHESRIKLFCVLKSRTNLRILEIG